MPLTYRSLKGAPLTADEIDGNFKDLETRLKQIEDHPEAGESLEKIQLDGDQITFTGSFGMDFGTFTLPKITSPQASPPLPLYERDTIPLQEDLGKMALLMNQEGTHLIFFDGKIWQQVMKGDIK